MEAPGIADGLLRQSFGLVLLGFGRRGTHGWMSFGVAFVCAVCTIVGDPDGQRFGGRAILLGLGIAGSSGAELQCACPELGYGSDSFVTRTGIGGRS